MQARDADAAPGAPWWAWETSVPPPKSTCPWSITLYVPGRRLSHHMSPIQPRATAAATVTSAISVPRAALRTTLGWRSVSDDGAGRHLRVAVVGSGPAAFYAAGHLLASEDPPVEVDMIERLPTPWGLVRLGVAPDHPNLKTVSRAFERIARAAGLPLLRQRRGRERRLARGARRAATTRSSTRSGSQTDRRLGIPGEDLPGSWAATELVAWYNGHPDFQELAFDLSGERAVVVGNGNVALDVARMLALTREELAPTDTTDAAIEAIAGSGIREIVVLGRRGPVQAAWTSTELQEMGELAGADIVVDPAELELDPASEAELAASIEHRPAELRDPARVRGARA